MIQNNLLLSNVFSFIKFVIFVINFVFIEILILNAINFIHFVPVIEIYIIIMIIDLVSFSIRFLSVKFIRNNLKTILLSTLFWYFSFFIFIAFLFIFHLGSPFTYKDSSFSNQSIIYESITPINYTFTTDIRPPLNNLGILYLSFKPLSISGETETFISPSEMSSVRNATLSIIISEQNNIIYENQYKIIWTDESPFVFPVGFPLQEFSKNKEYKIVAIFSDIDEYGLSIATNNESDLLVEEFYTVPSNQLLSSFSSAKDIFSYKYHIYIKDQLFPLFIIISFFNILTLVSYFRSKSSTHIVFLLFSVCFPLLLGIELILLFFHSNILISTMMFSRYYLTFLFSLLSPIFLFKSRHLILHELSINTNNNKYKSYTFRSQSKITTTITRHINNNNFHYFLVLFIFFAGFLIRIWKLGSLGLWWDEIITGSIVTRIHEIGTPLLPSEINFYWRGIAYHYILALITFIFGNSEFWLRLPSVLFGLGIIFFSYLIVKQINKSFSIVFIIFQIFSTYNIEYSRFARFYVMNSFLFMLSLWLVWKGFFENNLKYKLFFLITLFVAVHTVQFSIIILSLILAWWIIKLEKLIAKHDSLWKFVNNNKSSITTSVLALLIVFIGNIPDRILNKPTDMIRAITLESVVSPRTWNYVNLPSWNLFKFFSFNVYTISIISICIFILILFHFLHLYSKSTKLLMFSYVSTALLTSVLMYEIGSRDVSGPRIFFYAESLISLFCLLSFFITLKILFNYFKLKQISPLILTSLLAFIIFLRVKPTFIDRINMNYGDEVTNDPFRTTHVAAYRSDSKSIFEYVKNNKGDNDIWISVIDGAYYYSQDKPHYILNQNKRWNTSSYISDEGYFIDSFYGSILINSSTEINEVIQKNKGRNVWLSVSGSSLKIYSTIHVSEDFQVFLKENSENVVYISPDKIGMVLLFN